MSAWQPIETAPRDNKPILLFDPTELSGEVCMGHYYGDDLWLCISLQNPYFAPERRYDFDDPYISLTVTHWMPLPEAP